MYEYFESFGFNYGPSFRPIQDVFFSEKGQATAKVNMDYWKSVIADKDIQTHVIHPTTLDGILQLAFPAFTKGCAVHIPTMVPTLINHLWISNLESSPDGLVEISMKAAERGYRGACAAFRAVHASTKKACIAGDFEMTYVFKHE
ncbi:hypothetical protein DID88_010443 [Monilinia fructigena]|uniref:PKS/mFAS DH domain-containing protein n=1 Tax=Monilinia fructigena TaxID=38457 RepID=A0A395INX0_9HELO|nr:hypothetical protein DID88_010443 [Monilinia fructigena]